MKIKVTEGKGDTSELRVVTSEPVWRGVMSRSLDPRSAVSSNKMTVSPDLQTLAKFFTFFDFD